MKRVLTVRIFAEDGGVIEINPLGSEPQLEVDFSCTKTIAPNADSATLRIMNLSHSTRSRIAGYVTRSLDVTAAIAADPVLYGAAESVIKTTTIKRGECYVEIDGGYFPTTTRMFEGSSQWARHYRNGPTWVTEMNIGDGLSTMMQGVASKSFPPGATLFEVIEFVVKTMALGLGNLSEDVILEIVGPGRATFPFGFTAFGESKWLLSELVQPFDGEWFVDAGEIYFVKSGESLPDSPVQIGFGHGMINTPEGMDGGMIRVRNILRPDIRIGRKATLTDERFAGTYRIETVHHAVNNRAGVAITDVILSPGRQPF